MKPIDVKSDCYTEYNVDSNAKNAKFKIGDHVRISNYKNIFAKGYAPNWSAEVFVIKRAKITVPPDMWSYSLTITNISGLSGEEIDGIFYEKELQKTNQTDLRIEKAIKKESDELYDKWKDYDNSFNSWISKRRRSIAIITTI